MLEWADRPLPSGFTTFPTKEKPDTLYKFSGFVLSVSLDMLITERETYGVLEWLGDIGGLFDALRYIGYLLIAPIASYHLKTELLSSIFNKQKTQRSAPTPATITDLS